MSIRRILLVHVLVFGVVAGSFYDILTRQEHWPFSNYPMFSTVHRQTVLTWLRLFGVTAEGREFPLLSYNDLWPLDQSRLPLGLRRIVAAPGGDERARLALTDVMLRYNARRENGDIEGPAIEAVRLYRMSWPLEPFARNLETPSSKVLIAESRVTAVTASAGR